MQRIQGRLGLNVVLWAAIVVLPCHAGAGQTSEDTGLLDLMPPPKPPSKPKVVGWAKERVVEHLGRGVVAVPCGQGRVYVGWRLLESDPQETGFNVYRYEGDTSPTNLNREPLVQTTDFIDAPPRLGSDVGYFVCPAVNGREGDVSERARVRGADRPTEYLSIKLAGEYVCQKVGIADLNGDGEYDFVIKQPDLGTDPWDRYWHRSEGTFKIEAYLSDGRFLWRNDLGWSIEQGVWYSPFVVHDFDGDGKAEVAIKTGEGDPRDSDGMVTSGPEFLSIWDGMTGKPITRTPWPSREGFEGKRETAYNLYARNQLGVGYLDGKTPCIIVARGTYGTMKVVTYQYHGGQLKELWRWCDREEGQRFFGQGAHFMHSADVDGDGRDEIILGSAVLDDNGSGLWSTGLGHPDHCYVGDIDPYRPGLEVYYGVETPAPSNGMCLVDAATGRILWGLRERTFHIHGRGLCADIDPSQPGMECYGGEADVPDGHPHRWLFSAKGGLLATEKTWDKGTCPKAIYWDGSLYRQVLSGNVISRFDGKVHSEAIVGNQIAWADVLGDWREEIITSVKGELRIYMSRIPAMDRRVCLMQDPIYRLDVAHAAMGYEQPPMMQYCPSARSADPQPNRSGDR